MQDVINGHHIHFRPGTNPDAVPLILLHGTGGDETSLLDIGSAIDPTAALLGLRGTVLEGPITRWFRRFGEGVFDLEDAARRADELANVIEIASVKLRFASAPIAIGYSNGANIGSTLLMRRPEVLQAAVLMRGMDSVGPIPGLSLVGKHILFLNGANDPLAPPDSRARMIAKMTAAGAEVSERISGPGHDIGFADAMFAREWLSLREPKVS